MAFKKPKQQPQFADLKGILAQSAETDNALYQTVQVLIDRLTQFQHVTLEQVADINNSISSSISTINNNIQNLNNSITAITGSGYAPVSTGAEPLEIMSDGAGSVLMVGFTELGAPA